MIYNGREVAFPAIMRISFYKVEEALVKLNQDKNPATAGYAKSLLKVIENHPELVDGIEDLKLLKKLEKPIKKIGKILFPETLTKNEIKVLTPPFQFIPFLTSERFDTIVANSGEDFSYKMQGVDDDTFYMLCCHFILVSYYGFRLPGRGPMKVEVFNQKQGFNRVYKMLVNADLLEYLPTERAVDITRNDFEQLLASWDDITLWKKKFPPNSWIMKGVTVMNLVDVTMDHSIDTITSNLLVKSTDSYKNIISGIHSLLGNTALKIGVMALDNNMLFGMNTKVFKSVLLKPNEQINIKNELAEDIYNTLIIERKPLSIPDIEQLNIVDDEIINRARAQKIQSLVLIPLIRLNKLIGFIMVGSKERYAVTQGAIELMNDLLPIYSVALYRHLTETQNKIEAIIQQECTTIHQSVKWRFVEEAKNFIAQQVKFEQPTFRQIGFDNVYPLYGQIDIKGSSAGRNKAIRADLTCQINLVRKILQSAWDQSKMPAIEELIYRLDSFKNELKTELATGSEHKIQNFLTIDIYPVFEHLKEINNRYKKSIEHYLSLLDSELKILYDERKKFDQTVSVINQKLASYLDEKQQEAQQMFPHYFERYKTDGIEYNLYIGASITKGRVFNKIYLRNLRLWQLATMCELENEFLEIKDQLPTPMEVSSLILVYSTPISIHFRMDEKQFDINGAYNARYEIIKKRIDKAHIKGTKERITHPGKIAIIYTQDQDAEDYRMYLRFLASKGYIKRNFEDHPLEDLQGISGLNALRAEVDFKKKMTVEEIIEAFEDQPN
ncbi:MAG: GAF domain-containing protein [Cyclobacteriaceae bacterium]